MRAAAWRLQEIWWTASSAAEAHLVVVVANQAEEACPSLRKWICGTTIERQAPVTWTTLGRRAPATLTTLEQRVPATCSAAYDCNNK